MPDRRTHRGAHPADAELFASNAWPVLGEAVGHLSWLLTREYASRSALKLVGDRFQLHERQRTAVARAACSDQALDGRRRREVSLEALGERSLWIDGFNLLTTIEAALSGGVILDCRDGCYRDMASMHGSYRKVEETLPAVVLIGRALTAFDVAECHWLLDRPVSNSGRLCEILRRTASENDWPWSVELVPDPDPILAESEEVVVSADSMILDRCMQWSNLARFVVTRDVRDVEVVPMHG